MIESLEGLQHSLDNFFIPMTENYTKTWRLMNECKNNFALVGKIVKDFNQKIGAFLEKEIARLSRNIFINRPEAIKMDVEKLREKFLDTLDDLKVVSLNLSIGSLRLGEKGASLAKISSELAERSKSILPMFENIITSVQNAASIMEQVYHSVNNEFQKVSNFSIEVTSFTLNIELKNFSQYMQLHDMVTQELDIIRGAAGEIKNFYESQEPEKMRMIKPYSDEISKKLNHIRETLVNKIEESVMRLDEFLTDLNKGIEFLNSYIRDIENLLIKIEKDIRDIYEMMDRINESLKNLNFNLRKMTGHKTDLKRFEKYIEALRVLSFVEAERIGDKSIKNLVEIMNDVSKKLKGLSKDVIEMLNQSSSAYSSFVKASKDMLETVVQIDVLLNKRIETELRNGLIPRIKKIAQSLKKVEGDLVDIKEKIKHFLKEIIHEISSVQNSFQKSIEKISFSIPKDLLIDSEEMGVDMHKTHIHEEGDIELFI